MSLFPVPGWRVDRKVQEGGKRTRNEAQERPRKRRKKVTVEASKHVENDSKQHQKGLTTLQEKMKSRLDGARFRWINETLYKSNSKEAVEMMKEDPKAFEEVS